MSRWKPSMIALLLAVALDSRAVGEEGDPLAELQGRWVATRVDHDRGEWLKDPSVCTLTISGNEFDSCGEWTGTIRVRTDSQPAELDLTLTEGPHKGGVDRCIYKVMGDTLILCGGAPLGSDRPKEFVADASTGTCLVVYQRVRDDN